MHFPISSHHTHKHMAYFAFSHQTPRIRTFFPILQLFSPHTDFLHHTIHPDQHSCDTMLASLHPSSTFSTILSFLFFGRESTSLPPEFASTAHIPRLSLFLLFITKRAAGRTTGGQHKLIIRSTVTILIEQNV